jgi:serine/threonine-protein kinase HipA
MPETKLFGSKEQGYYFGVKRFDRLSNQRFHVHTFGNLIHSNYRIPSQDYDDLLKLTKDLTKNYECQLSVVRQMVFNIIFNNRDDHVKNFAFIMDHNGDWSLSPAYDITFSAGPNGEHTMTIMGEGKTPTAHDVYKVCDNHSIKQKEVDAIIERIIDTSSKFPFYAERYSVPAITGKEIASKIKGNIATFYP